MKTSMKYVIPLAIAGIAVAAVCLARPGIILTPPTVVVSAPPPVAVSPEPVVVVPDSYVWDGYEYVGVVDGQYYYLGPGNVWIVMDPMRLHRFDIWAGHHPDWRARATHNVRYRSGSAYHPHPIPTGPPAHSQPMATPQHTPAPAAAPGHNQPPPVTAPRNPAPDHVSDRNQPPSQ